MKKILTLVLALCMLSSYAFAEDLIENIDLEPGFPVVKEPVSVTIALVPTSSAVDFQVEQNWMTEYINRNSGLDIEWMVIDATAATERIPLMLNSGDMPDAILGHGFQANDIAQYGASEGMFYPVNELLDYMPIFSAFLEENPAVREGITTPDGNIYGFPALNNIYSYAARFFIDQTWLDRVGLENPTTLEEFKNMLIAFRDEDANGNGDPDDEIPWGGSWSGAYAERDPIFYALGYAASGNLAVDHNKENPDIVFVPYEAQYKDYLLYMNDLWNEGLLDPDMFTQAETQVQADVLEGTIGFCAMSAPYVYAPETKDNWVAINAMSKEEGGLRIYPAANPVYIPAFMVLNADCEEEVAAALAALADEMYSVEWYGWSMYGPEAGSELDYFGTGHYVEDGVIKYNMPDDVTNEWSFRCTYLTIWNLPGFNSLQYDPYYQLYAEQFPDTQLGQLFATGNYFEDWQPNFIETYQPYYAESIPTFYFTEDDLDRINTLQTPLDDYVASMEAKFITGEISIEDEYDNFVATLEEYGVQEYVELYNSYYGG
ncbi:MAG TPA: hypothetical protein IAA64_02505 [Candidatus Ornithocaccomicrobium faecavium]|uniref:Aldouronate transport system substrate-binding protein n=1 Tax=Candidatus Ornithocaccomicrobium faecavium TaxID=2840890 RepID=A0A9D1TBU4_9FIRM|nr:hypothetical protein [Candidatus Ornithocaccomicrobium faecavium]